MMEKNRSIKVSVKLKYTILNSMKISENVEMVMPKKIFATKYRRSKPGVSNPVVRPIPTSSKPNSSKNGPMHSNIQK